MNFYDYQLVGKVAIKSWNHEPNDTENDVSGVDWILAHNWVPFQNDNFVTPAFAAYVSGHSTFSRAAAEVMTLFTGDPYFPGGLGEKEFDTDFLEFEDGPSQTITLQWASYYDAADEAGISRLWGGIHIPADDFAGRVMGSSIGIDAYQFSVANLFEANLLLGDVNSDGVVDPEDISAFISILINGQYSMNCDVNRDGVVNFADIPPFIEILMPG